VVEPGSHMGLGERPRGWTGSGLRWSLSSVSLTAGVSLISSSWGSGLGLSSLLRGDRLLLGALVTGSGSGATGGAILVSTTCVSVVSSLGSRDSDRRSCDLDRPAVMSAYEIPSREVGWT
jgi:hypothetical protein